MPRIASPSSTSTARWPIPSVVSRLLPGHDRAVRSCARPRRRGGRAARPVRPRNHGAAERIHVAIAGDRQRHAKAQARRRRRDIAVQGIPAMLTDLQRHGIKTAIVSSDSEASVRQVLGPDASLINRFDCGAAMFGKHWKFRRVARKLGAKPSETTASATRSATSKPRKPPAWIWARWHGATRFRARCRRRGRRICSIRSRR